MLFSIQSYVEDFISRRNLVDADGYAVHVANLYFNSSSGISTKQQLSRVRRIRTVFFENNGIGDRPEFEKVLIDRLDKRFKKKLKSASLDFPGGTGLERRRLAKLPRRGIDSLLNEFKHAIESKAVDVFWESRIRGKLRRRPEKIAQSLFAMFGKGVIGDDGLLLREVKSGIGYVDIGIVFSRVLHLVEIKLLTNGFTGPAQLEQYMKMENRRSGSLLVVDARKASQRLGLPDKIRTPSGTIKVLCVDINPVPPSRH